MLGKSCPSVPVQLCVIQSDMDRLFDLSVRVPYIHINYSSATHKLDSSLPGQHYPCLRSYEKSCRLPYARECQIPNRLSAISDCALYTTNPPKIYHVSSKIKYYLNRLNLIFSLIPVLAFNDDNIMGKIREKDAFHFLVFLEFFSLRGDVISD